MRNSNNKIAVLMLLVVFLGISVSYTILPLNITHISQKEFDNLKPSDGELTIVTPENKTYTEVMSGYYPGSVGFEDDEIGTIPDDWWYHVPDGGSFYRVVDEWQGRKNVYEIRKNGGTQKVSTSVNFTSPASAGSVDFWLYKDTESNLDPARINLEDGYESDYFTFGFEGGTFYTGTWQNKQQIFPNAFSKNKWHYVRVDFNLSVGWQVQIDDTIYGDGYAFTSYVGTPTQVMNFQIESLWSGDYPNYGTWVDSIGYSWDPNYNIGDNKQEGLLLGFNNNTPIEWQGYSLNGQSNNTINGNYTIRLPENGVHTIQVFGNNSLGTMYESNLRYFTVNYTPPSPYISINTPDNKTYSEPMSGYFPGTYGFESDLAGSIASGWHDESAPSCSVTVVDSAFGRNKVLFFNDDSSGGNCMTGHILSTPKVYGTVEAWIRVDNPNGRLCLCLFEDETHSNFATRLYHDNSLWQDATGTSITKLGGGNFDSPPGNRWHHVRIDFERTTGGYMGLGENKCQYWIDGQQSIEYDLSNNVDVGEIAFYGSNSESYYDCWVDAVSFSWDTNYNVGENSNEGLLFSFDSNVEHDWTAFSLDGQANQTIFGNTTLPIPSDGLHSVQIFANDTLGAIVESNIRYFTTNLMAPDISIISPTLDAISGINAPGFDISITDVDLDATWYSLDGGITNILFTGLTGTIDQAEWDKIGNGTATITFYANDTINNIGQAVVTIRKDIIAPVILVIEPNTAEQFDYTPIFEISISEANLDEFWYTIDEGITNYTITSLTGTINQIAWDAAQVGPVTIEFYARDEAGNIGTENVIVAKISSDLPTTPPRIPSYNLIALLGVFCMITIILIDKKRGNLK